jgi:O-6-methylguanine DNA methyltransferase
MSGFVEVWEVSPSFGLYALSTQAPDLILEIQPLGFRWAVRGSGPSSSLERLRAWKTRDAGVVELGGESKSALTFAFAPSGAEASVLRRIATGGGFVIPPMMVRDGTLRVKILSESGKALPFESADRLRPRLVSRRRLTASRLREELDRLLPEQPLLTSRQSDVLLTAVRRGYYDIPRRIDVMGISKELSLGRSTVEEHLRAAESIVVRSAVKLIDLGSRASGSEDEAQPIEHFVRFSSELALYVDLTLRGNRVTGVRLLETAPAALKRNNHPHLERILRHLRTGTEDLRDVPVDLKVSPFERRVLEELRRIPAGTTRTYAEIAGRIGQPGAARAVGNAVAHNPAVVLIPCHRVVPARGGIGNYSAAGGPETKRRLLTLEHALRESGAELVPARPRRAARRFGDGHPRGDDGKGST